MVSSMTARSTRNEQQEFMVYNACQESKKQSKPAMINSVKTIHGLQTNSKKINILNCPNCRESLFVNLPNQGSDTSQIQVNKTVETDISDSRQKSQIPTIENKHLLPKYNSRNIAFVPGKQHLHRVINHEPIPVPPPQFDYLPACRAYQNDNSMYYNCMSMPPLTCGHYPPCPLVPATPFPIPCVPLPHSYPPVCRIPLRRMSQYQQQQPLNNVERLIPMEEPFLQKRASSVIFSFGSEHLRRPSNIGNTASDFKIDRSSQYVTVSSNSNSIQSFLIPKVSSTVMVRDMGCQFQSRFLKEMLFANEMCPEPNIQCHHEDKAFEKHPYSNSTSSHSFLLQKASSERVLNQLSFQYEPNRKLTRRSDSSIDRRHNLHSIGQVFSDKSCYKCQRKRSLSPHKGSQSDTSCFKNRREYSLNMSRGSLSETSCIQSKQKKKLPCRTSGSDTSCSSCELQKVVPLSILKKEDIATISTTKKNTGVKWENQQIKELFFKI